MIARVRRGVTVLRTACEVLLELASLAALYRGTGRGADSNPYIHPMGG